MLCLYEMGLALCAKRAAIVSTCSKLTAILAVTFASLTVFPSARAVDVYWINGPGNNTLIDTNYGTATAPLSWFDTTKWFTDRPPQNTPQSVPYGMAPIDGDTVNLERSCCNPEPFVTIDNGGTGVNLPNSNIRFDAKTNIFDSGAGDLSDVGNGSYDFNTVDDSLIANEIAFNGAGGAANDIFVPVVANSLTSNRHGGVFNVSPTIGTIDMNGTHQQKWIFNAVPTAPITSIVMRDRDSRGRNHDDAFTVNVDMETASYELVWGRIFVGEDATFDIGALQITDDEDWTVDNNGGNTAFGRINELHLTGNMTANSVTFQNIDLSNNETFVPQADGTYGSIGTAATVDNEVEWIIGDGVLTIGAGSSNPDGDYNDDGVVDLADYTVWRNNLGEPAGSLPNDPGSGSIGTLQFTTWKNNFGSGAGAVNASAVPEPSTIALLFGAAGLGLFWRRQQ